jgi:hypothetical protein
MEKWPQRICFIRPDTRESWGEGWDTKKSSQIDGWTGTWEWGNQEKMQKWRKGAEEEERKNIIKKE